MPNINFSKVNQNIANDHMGNFSLFADFANVFAYLVVFWFDFEHASHISMHPKEMDLKGLPFFTGVAIYCYEGAGMILSLEASIAKDYRSRFKVFNP